MTLETEKLTLFKQIEQELIPGGERCGKGRTEKDNALFLHWSRFNLGASAVPVAAQQQEQQKALYAQEGLFDWNNLVVSRLTDTKA